MKRTVDARTQHNSGQSVCQQPRPGDALLSESRPRHLLVPPVTQCLQSRRAMLQRFSCSAQASTRTERLAHCFSERTFHLDLVSCVVLICSKFCSSSHEDSEAFEVSRDSLSERPTEYAQLRDQLLKRAQRAGGFLGLYLFLQQGVYVRTCTRSLKGP